MFKHILLTTAVALTATGAMAFDKGEDRAGMTRAEVLERAAQSFDEADTDGDGTLSRDEMKARAKNMKEMHEARKEARGEFKPGEMRHKSPEDVFAKIDADGNGEITKSEFDDAIARMQEHARERGVDVKHKDPEARFEKMDLDGSGSVSKEEFLAAAPKHDGQRRPDLKREGKNMPMVPGASE